MMIFFKKLLWISPLCIVTALGIFFLGGFYPSFSVFARKKLRFSFFITLSAAGNIAGFFF